MSMKVEPVILTGNVVRLEPLHSEHAEALFRAAQDPAIWFYMPYNPSLSLAATHSWIDDALEAQARGKDVPFVIIQLATGEVVGSTRYLTIAPQDRGVEIGGTWLARAVQRSPVNTECKYLLLSHAFEMLGAIRVQFKTDSRNLISQRAIERLGAIKEGILRNHMILPDGYYRHSVYYSVLDTEWATVKTNLEAKMLLIR
ncbi:MAG: GNAT family protein [Ktedonobacteraceae bacterium]